MKKLNPKKGEIRCEDCWAIYPKKYNHRCVAWVKKLVAKQGGEDEYLEENL